MGQSVKRRRLCCSITLAQPACHRGQAGKIYPPAIQRSASAQSSVAGQTIAQRGSGLCVSSFIWPAYSPLSTGRC